MRPSIDEARLPIEHRGFGRNGGACKPDEPVIGVALRNIREPECGTVSADLRAPFERIWVNKTKSNRLCAEVVVEASDFWRVAVRDRTFGTNENQDRRLDAGRLDQRALTQTRGGHQAEHHCDRHHDLHSSHPSSVPVNRHCRGRATPGRAFGRVSPHIHNVSDGQPLLCGRQRQRWRPRVRHKSVLTIGCVSLLLALSTVEAEAHRQWYPYPYPYPVFGFPPGFYHGDHVVAVRLLVTPREALVYVDGYAAGVVDDFDGVFQRLRLMPGHHEIVVYHPGHRTLRQNLYFNPGSTHTIRYVLDPLAPGEPFEPQPVPRALPGPGMPPPGAPVDPSRTGTLSLRVQPADATVVVDGQPWRGPAGQDQLVIQLPEGPHRVLVEKPGFQSFAAEIQVRAGETASINVSLLSR